MNDRDEILAKVNKLVDAYKRGLLGGEKMPEDENPGLDKSSAENYMYFTLPMALNYQRNSYVLWECANRMYADENTKIVFDSRGVCTMPEELLRKYLVEYKVALQPNKQPLIWKKICETIETKFDGDIRNLFVMNDFSVLTQTIRVAAGLQFRAIKTVKKLATYAVSFHIGFVRTTKSILKKKTICPLINIF